MSVSTKKPISQMITGCKVSQIVLDETNFLLGVQQRVYSSGVSKSNDSICHFYCGIFQIILPDEMNQSLNVVSEKTSYV